MKLLRRFAADSSGQHAIEFALVAVMCSAIIIAATGPIGQSVLGMFEAFNAAFEKADQD